MEEIILMNESINQASPDFKPSDKGYRGWFATWNNYTEAEYAYVCSLPSVHKVVGKEVGKQGTPHLQISIYFKHQKTFTAVKKLLTKCWLANAHNYNHIARYCRKENDFYEDGEEPKKVSVNHWADINKDIQDGMTWEELVVKYPEESIKWGSGLRSHFETLRPKYTFNLIEAYGSYLPWQAELLREIEAPPPARKIIWYVNELGGQGKTDMSAHLVGMGWRRFTNAKTSDIALAWNGENVVMDYSRCQDGHINYAVLEDLKNGSVFSPKYQSCSKMYPRPYVLVFSNFHPDTTTMSQDRWDIRII